MDDTMNTHTQAAQALLDECRTRPDEAILPAGEPTAPLLIEGQILHDELLVTLPSGDRWRYHIAGVNDLPFGRLYLVHIIPSDPGVATVFRPTGEGIHPYVGTAYRYGVERSLA